MRQEVRPLRFEARDERRQQRILTRVETGTEPGPTCIAWVGTSLAGGLGVQDERGVATDHTVRDRGTTLQIPQDSSRFHDVTVTVRGHQSPTGTLAVFPRPRCAPERLDEKNPTEPGFPTPDNVTCYLQTA